MTSRVQQLGIGEFAVLSAVLFSLVALSIDAMLPALPSIAADLGIADVNDAQLVIGLFFLGNGAGQLLFGPLSDAFGRKRVILAGLAVFMLGCIYSLAAETFTALLIGRVLQGLGAAAPRTVTISMIRDLYSGAAMGRIMSLCMAIFILVPTVAPGIGQVIIWISNWRYIFLAFLFTSFIATVWLVLRQPETLAPEHRRPLTLNSLVSGFVIVLRSRLAVLYTLATGCIFAAFLGFLSSIQQVFQDGFGIVDTFPLWFGSLALTIGVSSLLNARLVGRFGMNQIVLVAAGACTLISMLYCGAFFLGMASHFTAFMLWAYTMFFFVGLLFGNLNSLAMEPLGAVAGLGAAFIGFFATMISIVIGIPIGHAFDGTPLPMVMGFALLGACCWLMSRWAGNSATA